MPKPKLGYLLFDLPSDHEVEGSLRTECEIIEAIIHNRGLKARVKRVRVASRTSFKKYPQYRLNVQFVHLACHGAADGIGFLRGEMSWKSVAKQITRHLRPLNGGRRVIVFSCCHSEDGFEATKQIFAGYFSGAYHFDQKRVDFSVAITTWAMFYLKKNIAKPHGAIVEAINKFLEEDVLVFRSYESE